MAPETTTIKDKNYLVRTQRLVKKIQCWKKLISIITPSYLTDSFHSRATFLF